jgi:DMSO/TMAO reductase YedYZ molybdopterin-dependent catalytic subunit
MKIFSSVLAVIFAGSLAGCNAQPQNRADGALPATDLGPVEIRQFQGKKLTDFGKLRDNSISGPVAVDTATYRLVVDGLVARPLKLRYTQVLGFPRYQKLITLYCVEGWNATGLWEGIRIRDLLDSAKVKPGATTLIFHAADGEYTTSLPLKLALGRDMLLAHKINNAALDAKTGFPFMLAAEDRLGYKWIKWLQRIEVSSDSAYQGFWEKRGYDNKADID